MNTSSRAFLLLIIALFALLTPAGSIHAQSASKIYAKFSSGASQWSGPVVTPTNRVGWVQLQSLSFGLENPVSFTSGGGTTVGRTSFQNIVFYKEVDRLTPQIFATLASGSVVPVSGNAAVIVDFVANYGANERTFMTLEFKTVYFTQQTSTPSSGESLYESVTMIAGSMRLTWWALDANGNPGTPIVTSWNVISNTAQF